jgi:predicted O-methyltransferase YrrM
MKLHLKMTPPVEQYITEVSAREPDALRLLREETAALPSSLMQIPPEQGQFLATLVRAIRARRTLEIGVFTGYSLLATALALPADGEIVAFDNNEFWTSIALDHCKKAGVAHKIDLRLGDAEQQLAALLAEDGAAGSFDFAFVDANKEGYLSYFEAACTLLRPGGLLVFDNVLWHGAVANPAATDSETVALREFNARLREDDRVDMCLLPLSDGISLAVRR